MKNIVVIGTLAALSVTAAHAGPRTSASYQIATDTLDRGGGRAVSAAYSNVGTVGGIVGTASVAAPAEIVKSGYAGQLNEFAGLTVSATPPEVNEGGTRQLAARAILDDASLLALDPAFIVWDIVSGPLSAIIGAGVVNGGPVYQDTPATVRGTYGAFSNNFTLTVRNVNSDNFGSYTGDGIDDAWQVQYFGIENPLAGPGVDFSGTGQTNLFKYLTGLDPLDPSSVFRLEVFEVAGQAAQKQLEFGPIESGRIYATYYSDNLQDWHLLTSTSASAPAPMRTLIDTAPGITRRFYNVQISLGTVETVLTASVPTLTNQTGVTFSFTANLSPATFLASLDGAAEQMVTSPRSYSLLNNGPHTFTVRAVDAQGNADATPASFAWTIDSVSPIIYSLNPSSTSTSITIAWTTSEAATAGLSWGLFSALSNVVPEDSVFATSHSITFSGLTPNQLYSYKMFGRDAAGNTYASPRRTLSTTP